MRLGGSPHKNMPWNRFHVGGLLFNGRGRAEIATERGRKEENRGRENMAFIGAME